MELTERKLKILKAIISSYLESAEPVGSRTIFKNYNLGISPATIRNEMSDLEDLGYIIQPHTSAGRIPSDKGYRLYVDALLENQKLEMKKIAFLEELVEKADRIENLLKDCAKLLAKETNYATMISTPQYKRSKIKNIQLITIEPTKLMAIIVTSGNIIKNYMFDISEPIDQYVLNRLTFVLNENLYGLTLEQINLPLIKGLQEFAGVNADIVSKVLELIFHTIKTVDDTDIYTSGATNILKLPEFHDVSKAMEIINTIEEKEKLKKILNSVLKENEVDESGKIRIKIGKELEFEEMKDCSVITTSYNIGEGTYGAIGIIGPKRMDYMHTIASLKELIRNLEKMLNNSD